MSVNLQKDKEIDLTKNNPSLKRIVVGLSWDDAERFSENLYCDASAILCKNGKLTKKDDVVCFYNRKHKSKAVILIGDNLTGDYVHILIDLSKVPEVYDKIVFVANIYECLSRKQHFGMMKNVFIRIVDVDTHNEICRYNLSENYDAMTAIIFGEVYWEDDKWKFNAICQPTKDTSIEALSKKFE